MRFITENKAQYVETCVAALASAIISFFFLLKSPLHPWIGSDTGTDSSVFKTVALMMEKGLMPYKNSFDHKGPLLYIINWFGNRLSPYRGVWIIEFLFMIITILMLYKTTRLLCEKCASAIVVFTSFSLLYVYFESGNLTEEYAMTFISIALFIFLDYLNNGKISNLRLIICGFCLGCTLLLRPNMIASWAVMCTAILIKTLINKNWLALRRFVGWFSLGMSIIIVPIIIWLGVNDALEQFWKDYIIFNNLYVSYESEMVLFQAKWNSFFTFFNTTVYLIALSSLIFIGKTRDCFLNITYIVYMLITLWFMCLSGMTYGHYGMVLIPAVVYPLALIFSEIERIEINNISKVIEAIVSIYMLSVIIIPNWVELIETIPSTYAVKDIDHKTEITKAVTEIIDLNTTADETISVYGNWDIIYVLSNRKHATRYSYQFPVGQIMPEIMDEYINQLQDELPHFIVIQYGHYNNTIKDFLNKNKYELYWSENGNSMDGVLIYTK